MNQFSKDVPRCVLTWPLIACIAPTCALLSFSLSSPVLHATTPPPGGNWTWGSKETLSNQVQWIALKMLPPAMNLSYLRTTHHSVTAKTTTWCLDIVLPQWTSKALKEISATLPKIWHHKFECCLAFCDRYQGNQLIKKGGVFLLTDLEISST